MKKLKVRQANICRVVFIITFLISCTRPVQLPGEPTAKQTISKKSSTLNFCYKPDTPSSDLFTCVGHQMLEKLQDLEEKEEFNLAEGVIMKRDESGPRDISNYLDKDPMDFRSIVEGASTLMSRRAMQWDMSYLHPGLNLRIGPTLSSNGVLEFVMDPRIRDREIIDHEPSTVRLLTRQLLVPFLLGFKFQLSTLMPILFGLMVIVSKKALILAKIAVLASGIFGYNSLFGGNGGHGPGGGYYGGHGPGFSAYGNRYHGNDHYYKHGDIHSGTVENLENLDPYYSASTNHGDSSYKSGPAQSPEDLRERLERLFSEKHGRERINGARNFAWNE